MARAQVRAHAAAILAGLAVSVASSLGLPAPAEAGSRHLLSSVNLSFYKVISRGTAARMAKGGVRSVRFALDWFGIEANQGTYDWHESDAVIGNLASHGVRSLPVLFGTPGWAVAGLPANPFPTGNASLDSTPVPLIEPGDDTAYSPTITREARNGWAQFVQAAVRRYGPRGTYWKRGYRLDHPGARPLPVRIWQIWNEPNLDGAFWPGANVDRYGALVKLSARSIHSVDPTASVALAGVPGRRVDYEGTKFLNRLFTRVPHIRRYFDLVAFHPYAPRVSGVIDQLRQLRRVLRRDHDPRVRLWVSEASWGSGKQKADDDMNRGPRGQARMLHRLFAKLQRRHRALGLWRVTWFDWRDPRSYPACRWCAHAGLIDWRGQGKPAWRAYRSLLHRLP